VLVAASPGPEKSVGVFFWQRAPWRRYGHVFPPSAGQDAGHDRPRSSGRQFLEGEGDRHIFVPPSTPEEKTSPRTWSSAASRRRVRSGIVADMLDEKGASDKDVTANAAVDAEGDPQGTSPRPRGPRATRVLWGRGDKPQLYTLRLKVKPAAGLDGRSTHRVRFPASSGGRRGRKIYLKAPRSTCVSPASTTARAWQVGGPTVLRDGGRQKRGYLAAIPPTPGRDLDDADRKGYLVARARLNATGTVGSGGSGSSGSRIRQAGRRPRCGVDAPIPQTTRPWVMWVGRLKKKFSSPGAVDADRASWASRLGGPGR